MNPNREELLFQLALTKPTKERAEFLKRECGKDAVLHQRLEALLAAHEAPDEALAKEAPAIKATMKIEFADTPGEAVGQTLGRYKLLGRVGEGGCSVVYVAEQTEAIINWPATPHERSVKSFFDFFASCSGRVVTV